MQQIIAKLYDPTARRGGRSDGADAGPAGERPAADVHLQHPRPRSPVRLRPAPLPDADGPAPPGQRDQRRRGRCADDGRRAPSRHGPALLPPQGRSCWSLTSSTTTTATRRFSPTCRRATGRRHGASCEESYAAFSPQAGAIIREFFDKRWIDAELRAGKRGGAFSSSAVPSVHPYILMNFTDRLRDVMTLAHELGHGAAPVPVAAGRLPAV